MKNKLIIIAAALLLASCDKREFYSPVTEEGQIIERPGQAIATVTSGTIENAQVYFYAPGKPNINTTTGTPIDIEAGNYQVIIVTNNENLTINGTTVTLPVTKDGETIQAPVFHAGVGNIIVKEGEVTKLSIPIHPMSRKAQFQFSIRGIADSDIQQIEVLLYGILVSRNLSEGFAESTAPRSANSLYYLRTVPKQRDGNYYSTMWLLGIDPTQKQKVAIHITLTNGTTYTFNEDVSSYLSDFNQGYADVTLIMKTEIILDLNEISGSITPWQPGNEDDIPMK